MATKKKTTAAPAPAAPTASPAQASLERFCDGGGTHEGFRFLRAWWQGDGPRPGIAGYVLKKLRPGDDPEFGRAARYDVLLPRAAPSEYMVPEHLLARYDEMLPLFARHAFAQITIDLDRSEPLHVGYERVRSYASSFTHSCHAVILVLHQPALALSANAPHCHLIIPARFLTAGGFGAAATALCSDPGHRSAWQAWQAHLVAN
ncbi:hypothetical protein [uncultured Sphingomonas sp.]|uniref:hypothetical protein n=1 Tax=uncultured Sphingomonas sp. TaxID=158754 RepID=UPI0026134A6A|nr:hypothetical protein [uncultured Sphingomonas sp.]